MCRTDGTHIGLVYGRVPRPRLGAAGLFTRAAGQLVLAHRTTVAGACTSKHAFLFYSQLSYYTLDNAGNGDGYICQPLFVGRVCAS